MSPDKTKVLIVGAGVAGLTLANLLEQLNINYLLFESHHEIAPDVGASIGLHPNGLRVLDQIGCYEEIIKHSAPVDHTLNRTEDGSVFFSCELAKEIKRR